MASDSPSELLEMLRRHSPSPAFELLGCAPLSMDTRSGEFRAWFHPSDQLLNAAGLVHGGQLCAMLDMVTSFAAVASIDFACTLLTLELKTSFLDRARQAPLLAIGRVRKGGRTFVFLEGELQQPPGRVVALASATAKLVDSARLPQGGHGRSAITEHGSVSPPGA